MKIQKLKTGIKFTFLILILLLATVSQAQAAPTFQAAGTAVSGTSFVNPAWPAHQINDIALLFIESAGTQAATLSTPAGFAAVTNSPQAVGTLPAGTQLTVFWARATSAAMATPTVADPGNHVVAQILTYRGVIANGNPWDVTGGGTENVSDTSLSATGVTTTVADTLIVVAAAQGFDPPANPFLATFSAWANVNLTGIAERTDYASQSGNGGGFGVIDGVMAATGATGNTTATLANNFRKAFLTIALQSPLISAIYAINNVLTPNGAIMRINPANSVATIVYSGAPFVLGSQATDLAQCPDGTLYFAEGSATGTLYRFNPNTPAVAPVAIGGSGTGIANMLRMTCHPTTGALYGMYTTPNTLYTINKATGAATAIPLTLPATTLPIAGSGDMGFDADGTLYYVGQSDTPGGGGANSVRLWIINLATNTFENVGAVTGLPFVANGIAFDNSTNVLNNGRVLLSLSFGGANPAQLYTVSPDGGAAAAIGVLGAMPQSAFDLSSVNMNVNVLQLTKTSDRTPPISPGGTITYTVVVTAGTVVNGAVFQDPAVTALNVSNVTCAAAGGATCPAVSVAAMQGMAGITIPAMPAGGSVTFTITATVTGNPTGTLTNTATVTLSGQTNSASDADAIKKARTTRWSEVFQ